MLIIMITNLYVSFLLLGNPALARASVIHPSSFVGYSGPHLGALLTGRVINESGAPLPGVIIAVQGSSTVSSTNSDGRFLVALPAAEPVLVFSCAGYRAQTVVAPADGPLAVTMYAVTGSGTDGGTAATGGSVSASGSARAAALPFAEVMPAFPGGDEAYSVYLNENVVYPTEALAQNLSGKVYVGFVVDEQGRICDAEVVKGCGHGFDEEALRVIRLMPWWTPARNDGKPVRVARTLRVSFRVIKQEKP